jgi:plasmid stabilization system protein ParE
MAYKISIGNKANLEWKEAFEWYANISPKNGLKFHSAGLGRLEEIAETPHLFGHVRNRRRYRRAKIKRFPYQIVFRIDETSQQVIILSIFHEKRNPSSLMKRLRK